MSNELTNEEIREKLLKLNYNCGPVTDTTREIHLKKLEDLKNQTFVEKKQLTDEELRSQLVSFGVSVAPITSTNRHIYLSRLQKLKRGKGAAKVEVTSYDDGCEPMEID